jgi:hypothetical protein
MLSREENELPTRTGPGTAVGDLLHRYWVPVILSSELTEPDDDPVRITLLGERLVAFRDTHGRVARGRRRCDLRPAEPLFRVGPVTARPWPGAGRRGARPRRRSLTTPDLMHAASTRTSRYPLTDQSAIPISGTSFGG